MAVMERPISRVGLIGFGEVGSIFAADLAQRGVTVAAWDLKMRAGGPEATPMQAKAEQLGVALFEQPAAALAGADLVVCAVTASQTGAAARECAGLLAPGALYLDVNSASPGTKIACAGLVDGAGGRYVEAAVMTSVPPYRLGVPMLLGGAFAAQAAPALADLGFAVTLAAPRLGVASATKMCRSIMIKGLEAMVIESFTAARAHGVEEAVLASLAHTFPGIDWEKEGAYFFHRVLLHGRRRAEEMREVAHTLREIGLEPLSASATALRDDWMAEQADALGLRETHGGAQDWREIADVLLAGRGA